MKKIFSFLVVCLLSSMAMGVLAQTAPPGVLFSDGTSEHWYNISFKRYTSQEKYWLVDHNISGALINRLLDENSPNFQWKFQLLPGSDNQFYMVNRQYGEYVASVDTRSGNFYIDTYGMTVPPEMVDDYGNPLARPVVDDSYVYYMDGDSKYSARVFQFQYSTAKSGWGIIDADISDSHHALNDWAVYGKIIAVWDLDDDGSIVVVDPVGVAFLNTSTSAISTGALINNTTQTTFTVKGRALNGAITLALEGPDAAAFTLDNTTFAAATKGGTVTVSFSPTELRAYSATIRISTPGADDKLITLTGEVYQPSDLPTISDDANEHWYYIQFQRPLTSTAAGRGDIVLAKNDDPADPTVMERPWKTGAPDPNQMWKICGSWTDGYYIVNKANHEELLYNTTNDPTAHDASLSINPNFDRDRYFLPETGFGNYFNLERYQTTKHWQLYNRDVSARNTDGSFIAGRRYANEWDGIGNRVHHWDKNDSGNELMFISADKPIIKPFPTYAYLKAKAGETKTATVKITGLATAGNINISVTGAGKDKFQVDPTSLPAEGGDITVTFTNDGETDFYAASMILSSAGATDLTVPLFGNSGDPVLCTPTQDVWGYLQFQRAASAGKVWQNNGFGKNITQTMMVPGDPHQQWKLIGSQDGLEIVNRAGGKVFYPKNANGATPNVPNDDNHRATVNETQSDLFSAIFNPDRTNNYGGGPGLWVLKLLNVDNTPEAWRIGVNDFSQNIVGLWGTDDWAGDGFDFIPVEAVEAHNPMIAADAPVTNLAAIQAGETENAKVTVTGAFLTGDIAATLTGDDAYKVSPATLPAEGGELTVTFAPTKSAQGYNAKLTLSSAGVKDVTVSFTGVTPPIFSTAGNDIWYFIQFERTANRTDDRKSNVWTSNGSGADLAQAQKENDYFAQQWKLVGDWKSEFVIESRDGGQISFKNQTDSLGVTSPTGNALIADAGEPVLLKQNGAKWEMQLANFASQQYSFLNDPGANGLLVGLWQHGDGGNFVNFIPTDQSGIKYPSIDTAGQLLSVKIYTLQGVEVRQPAATGVYILKKIYASGKTQVVKQLIVVK